MESAQGKLLGWRLQVRPGCGAWTRRSDSHRFQDQSAVEIIKLFEVPRDTDWQVKGTVVKRAYCVQLPRTDNFVSRLMEERHLPFSAKTNNHTLVTATRRVRTSLP